MEEIQEKKREIRIETANRLGLFSKTELEEKTRAVEDQLFEFANFLESKIVLMYINDSNEVDTREILKKCFEYNKIIVLPIFDPKQNKVKMLKIDKLDTDLKLGSRGILEPDLQRCKVVPIDSLDIAIIPGTAFDEKGGRIGSGDGYYDRMIPKLPVTTRKVALALECQIFPQIPMESHDKYIDIIITDKRVIYKI